jgi:hypothetical protein
LILICVEGLHWAKRVLLPQVDAVMVRLGMGIYYCGSVVGDNGTEEGGGGCILHVIVASIRVDVIPRMLK